MPTGQQTRTVKAPVLIYVPGLSSSDASSGMGVAQVIAASATTYRQGSYSVEVNQSAKPVSTKIKGPGGKTVLEVREVEYQLALRGIDGVPHAWQAGWYAVAALLRLLPALRSPAKTARSKFQLAWGGLLVLALSGAFVLGVLAAIDLAFPNRLPSLLTSESTGTTTLWGLGGLSVTAAFLLLRKKLLAGAQIARDIMQYCRMGQRHDTAVERLTQTIDSVRDDDVDRRIHVLGYSLGSLVALDMLFPTTATPQLGESRRRISSLTTVGCPVDMIRLYYSRYLEDRRTTQSALPWYNLFLPNDVIGSNLMDGQDSDATNEPSKLIAIAGIAPLESVAASTEQMNWPERLAFEGFATHVHYWGEPGEANYIKRYLNLWLGT